MEKIFSFITLSFFLLLYAQSALADSIVLDGKGVSGSGKSLWGKLNPKKFDKYGTDSEYDYSDADLVDERYSATGNDKGQWQGLGTSNGIDNGVLWSVGGSAFGTTADLVRGQDVTFKFLFWQANNGRHEYDQIFAAFDFGQDDKWNIPSDVILYEKISTINQWNDGANDHDKSTNLSRYLEFEVKVTVPETMTIGSTWLRVRAHCNHVLFGQITADNWLSGQGETEDYKLNITANPVPEPATLLLFGVGLVGLAGLRLRKKMK